KIRVVEIRVISFAMEIVKTKIPDGREIISERILSVKRQARSRIVCLIEGAEREIHAKMETEPQFISSGVLENTRWNKYRPGIGYRRSLTFVTFIFGFHLPVARLYGAKKIFEATVSIGHDRVIDRIAIRIDKLNDYLLVR